jgi:hypothetical protein
VRPRTLTRRAHSLGDDNEDTGKRAAQRSNVARLNLKVSERARALALALAWLTRRRALRAAAPC